MISKPPEELGFDTDRLNAALKTALSNETTWPRKLEAPEDLPGMTQLEPPPWNEILGPMKSRGGPSGVILRHGTIAAEWGNPERVDMTFSVAKSYLAVVAGLAHDDGLLPDIDEPVSRRLDMPEFGTAPNDQVTWRHLMNQTSEWRGTLFDKPDQVDHFRVLSGQKAEKSKGTSRELGQPGSHYEYNDVRVNVFSLALLHLICEPLGDYLKRKIMDPIGASESWRWHGYRNAVVMVHDRQMISVPGGSHWGGGLWIDSYDHARLGKLLLQGGIWQDRRLLSAEWITEMWRPSAQLKRYGLFWWLNTDREYIPNLPASSVFALGAGSNLIWIAPDQEMVVVARWIDGDAVPQVFGEILAAVN